MVKLSTTIIQNWGENIFMHKYNEWWDQYFFLLNHFLYNKLREMIGIKGRLRDCN